MATRYNPPDDASVLHFVTLNVRERKRAFCRPTYAQIALEELGFECGRSQGRLSAYAVMPHHMHFIIWLPKGDIQHFLTRFKPAVTMKVDLQAAELNQLKVRDWLQVHGRRELWQDGKHAVALWSGRFIRQKIRYIHENPVRAGLVEHPQDYLWSSYGAYYPELCIEPPVKVDTSWKY